ncbi:MAG: universal stress protein [Candidatus Nanohaloarchaea archaeon]|nr:universal stress protein [Candidatus Nanohaloarchaea archaeon]
MYDDILLPTDGSEGTKQAAEHAFILAERFDATIHVVHVIDTNSRYHDDHGEKDLRSDGRRSALQPVTERAEGRDIEFLAQIREGTPYSEINDYVEEQDVDMIVMGTHGRTGLDRMLIGSTAEKVVRTASVPVLTVRMEEG